MIIHSKENKRKISIGLMFACLYIISSYVAQDILISSTLNTIFLYAFLAISAYCLFCEKSIDIKRYGFVWWYLFFMIFSLAIMLMSPSISEVWGSFYSMIVSLFVAFSFQINMKNEKDFIFICWCYAIASFAFVLILLFTGNLKGDASNRLGQEILGNANIFAAMMMVGVMYSIWLLLYSSPKAIYKVMLLIMILLDMYSLALSGGRKFFIVPFIFLYILLMFRKDKNGKRHIVAYTLLFAVIFGVVWWVIMNVPFFYEAIGVRMQGLVDNVQGVGGDGSAEIRERMREIAINKWLERPFIGYGFDSFKYLAQQEVGHFYYSHCNYTELLYSGGIFYFILYYLIFAIIAKNSLQNRALPNMYKAFSIGVVISLFIFDYGAVSYNGTPQIVFIMMAFMSSTFSRIAEYKGELS